MAINSAIIYTARVLSALVLAGLAAAGCDRRSAELLDVKAGGDTTVTDATRNAFSRPAANLAVDKRAEFFIGNAFFNSAWIVAPASAAARDGLGPLFNARSCDACHNNDGRGRPPDAGERPVSLVVQFATPAPTSDGLATADSSEPHGDPRYGVNLNPFAIGGVPAEGTVRIVHREIRGQFDDGEPYVLMAPEYVFEDLRYGPIDEATGFSPRVAPAVFGAGLLEAIPEEQILEREDANDANGDGISGRANRVLEHREQRVVLGRFGWKANQPDIAHQTAAAFSAEIGMSTSLRPNQNCTEEQRECLAAQDGGTPEISDEIFAKIVEYQRMLAVPARRHVDSSPVREGAELFLRAGCESCHRASFLTAARVSEPALANQRIHPFTDLLLHDMGDALADNRRDFLAEPVEWRTPPLWGLGLQQQVNGHTRLLHDGRARNAQEAILWHGGEAAAAQAAFRAMSKEERAALLAFLDSL